MSDGSHPPGDCEDCGTLHMPWSVQSFQSDSQPVTLDAFVTFVRECTGIEDLDQEPERYRLALADVLRHCSRLLVTLDFAELPQRYR